MRLQGGYTNYGQEIGILMLDTIFPRVKGDIGNAYTFEFPVRYKTVRGAIPEKIMGEEPDKEMILPFLQAARELEAEGVRAITTSCGFLTPFQPDLASAVSIPVFTSSLVMVPLIRTMLNPAQKIAILTEYAENLNERHFSGAGWSSREIPVIVKGMKPDAVFPSVFIGNRPELELEVLQSEMEEMTRELVQDHPETGAIVLECTNMGPFSKYVRDIAGVPVFGINSLVEFVHRTVCPKNYL